MRPIAILALTTVALATPVSAQNTVGQVPLQQDGTTLDVNAEGRTTRVPDLAVIRSGVVTQAMTAAAALADNTARMSRVLAAVRRAGVADRDVQTSNISLSPQYKYVDGQAPRITGYQATNSVGIRFREVRQAGPILDALVAQGANQIDGPNLMLDKPDEALDEARTDAIRRARARADVYARAAGLRVVRIVSITEAGDNAGGPQSPTFVMVTAKRANASTEIEAGERDVTANVNVRFLLK